MKIIFTPKAIRKIEQIESYTLTEYSSDKANHFKQFLKTRIRSLKSFPYQGESIRDLYGFDTELRRLYVPPNNVIYKVENNNIRIEDIFNDKEDFIAKLFE